MRGLRGVKSGFHHLGVNWLVDPRGVYVKLDHPTTRLPSQYKSLVRWVTVKYYVPQHMTLPQPGRRRYGSATGVIEVYTVYGQSGAQARATIVVEGPSYGSVIRLLEYIRTDDYRARVVRPWHGQVPKA